MPLPANYISGTGTVRAKGLNKFVKTAALVHERWPALAAIDDDGYSAAHAGQAAASTVDAPLDGDLVVGGVGTPDVPRNVIVTVTHASSVVAMSGTIYGYDRYGRAISEAWSVTATGTSKLYTSGKAFARVTRITETVAADASDNTVIVGTGKTVGLSALCKCPSAVKEIAAGSVVTNGVVAAGVVGAATDEFGTYTPNGTPNGSNDFEIWYLASDS